MFSFLKINLYFRKFIIYILVLLSICLLFLGGAAYVIISGRVNAIVNDAQRAFENMESEINRRQEDVESLILDIYRSRLLLSDLLLLLGSDLTTYLGVRLDNAAQGRGTPSLIFHIRNFATENEQSIYHSVRFLGDGFVNYLGIYNYGLRFALYKEYDEALFTPDITRGIVFERQLADPSNPGESLGRAHFLLDINQIFTPELQRSLPNTVLVDSFGNVLTGITGLGESEKEGFREIDTSRYRFQEDGIYYIVLNSSQFEYSFITFYDMRYLIESSQDMLILAVIGVFAVFFAAMLLVTLNMRNEAAFLGLILNNITKMESGHFERLDYKQERVTEYGIIANALNDMSVKLKAHIRTEYLLKLKQREAEMIAMQHQVNPHFLYNTLEAIRSSATTAGANETADYIASLGQLYRSMVRSELEITMGQELDFLNAYLEVMEFKNSGIFFYRTEMDDSMLDIKTVKFWMQPIAENFFRHGFDKESEYNLFVLLAREYDDRYIIEMTNNGAKIDVERLLEINESLLVEVGDVQGTSIGLKNVSSRLKYYYGSSFSMMLSNNDEAGITVHIQISKEAMQDV